MRSHTGAVLRLGVLAVAVGLVGVPGVAQGAKVSETASGGLVPDAVTVGALTIQTPLTQEFNLKGKKVKGRQVLDVNLIMNSTSPDLDALNELNATLVAPKGESAIVLIPSIGQNLVNVKYDDQSELFPCNPLTFQRRDCNYLSGANAAGTTGTFSGSLSAGASVLIGFNAPFKGLNPKGTWTLYAYDGQAGVPNSTLGETTLEVKTGRKFAKED